MREPVDLDARHRLGGHGARTDSWLMAHCPLNQVTSLRPHQPPRQAAPVIAAAMSPRLLGTARILIPRDPNGPTPTARSDPIGGSR